MPAIRDTSDIDPWLEELWESRGTDLLLTAGAPPLIRVDGDMRPVSGEGFFTPISVENVVKKIVGQDLVARYEAERELDFAFSWRERARLRCNAFHQRDTCALSLRIIPFEIPGFAQLGIPPSVENLVELPMGLVIVTGPT
ncbi:MAG TPA: type IV pili twitching motility protein PilT, partial [Acidimicrobiales bacterium]|nr:type IV pili twitching motility protein PilT [Acidimicrobiales bacterium]